MSDLSDDRASSIRDVVEDLGPGIAHIGQAMAQGFSTTASLGTGLPGAKRLVDEFEVESQAGHTVVTVSVSRPR